jgi:hypothetical protein
MINLSLSLSLNIGISVSPVLEDFTHTHGGKGEEMMARRRRRQQQQRKERMDGAVKRVGLCWVGVVEKEG